MPNLEAKSFLTLDKSMQQQQIMEAWVMFWAKHNLIPRLAHYPITLQYAHKLQQDNVILVGDSAHAIHPIAGQGFNLTMRDISYIVKHLEQAITLGLPIYDNHQLSSYTKARKADHLALLTATHGLNALFGVSGDLMSKLRGLGLTLFDLSGAVKRRTMLYARATIAIITGIIFVFSARISIAIIIKKCLWL